MQLLACNDTIESATKPGDSNTPADAPPRESIETRTFAFWD
jgi:hypothetical protein